MTSQTAGYSGTPLAKKLGLKSGYHTLMIGAPDAVIVIAKAQKLASLSVIASPAAARRRELEFDYIHALYSRDVFTDSTADLKQAVNKLKPRLKIDGMLWLSWPKKAPKVPTDLDDAVVRKCGHDAGLVDVKVCAVDDVWSGFKFVYRLKDRGNSGGA